MAEQDFVFRPELATVFRTEVAHVDIIVRDIVLGVGIGLRHAGIDLCRHARREHVSHAGESPLLAAPVLAQRVLLLERVMWEVKNGHEGEFVREHIVREMRQRTIAGEDPVRCLRLGGIGQLSRAQQLYRQHVGRLKEVLKRPAEGLKERYALAVGLAGVVGNKLLQLLLCTVCRRPKGAHLLFTTRIVHRLCRFCRFGCACRQAYHRADRHAE